MSKDKSPRAFIKLQEIVELSPDDITEGFKCIAIQTKGFRCDGCDCMIYNPELSRLVCVMPFAYDRFKLCSKHKVCLKSLDKIMEDL